MTMLVIAVPIITIAQKYQCGRKYGDFFYMGSKKCSIADDMKSIAWRTPITIAVANSGDG